MNKNQEIYDCMISCFRSGTYCINGQEISIPCPVCGKEEGHFSINVRNGLYNCFKCHAAGSIKYLLIKNYLEWSGYVSQRPDTTRDISERYFPLCKLDFTPLMVTEELYYSRDKEENERSLFEIQQVRAIEYCFKRGMTKDQIERYRVSIRPFDSRIYFIYWDESDEVIFYTGRTIIDGIEPKTIEMKNAQKPLFGRHLNFYDDDVVLVEGVFDHFVTPNSYAIMGSSVTELQIQQLKKDGVQKIFLILDPDAGEQTMRAAQKLSGLCFSVFPIIISGSRDPADIGRESMTRIVNMVRKNCPIRPQCLYFNSD